MYTTKIMKLILVVMVVLRGAQSFFGWLWKDVFNTWNIHDPEDGQDMARMLGMWGWWEHSSMQEHWERYRNPEPGESKYHVAKNVGAEHARADPQRAYKMYSFLILAVSLFTFVMGLALGALAF